MCHIRRHQTCDFRATKTFLRLQSSEGKVARCNRGYTRANRNRHYRSYECRVTIFVEF